MSYIMSLYLMKKNAIQSINYLFIQCSVILALLFVLFCNSKALIGLASWYMSNYTILLYVSAKNKKKHAENRFLEIKLERVIDIF